MGRHTDRQTHSEKRRDTDRQTHSENRRDTDRQTHSEKQRHANRFTYCAEGIVLLGLLLIDIPIYTVLVYLFPDPLQQGGWDLSRESQSLVLVDQLLDKQCHEAARH